MDSGALFAGLPIASFVAPEPAAARIVPKLRRARLISVDICLLWYVLPNIVNMFATAQVTLGLPCRCCERDWCATSCVEASDGDLEARIQIEGLLKTFSYNWSWSNQSSNQSSMAKICQSNGAGFETKCNCHEFLSELVSSEQKVVSGGWFLRCQNSLNGEKSDIGVKMNQSKKSLPIPFMCFLQVFAILLWHILCLSGQFAQGLYKLPSDASRARLDAMDAGLGEEGWASCLDEDRPSGDPHLPQEVLNSWRTWSTNIQKTEFIIKRHHFTLRYAPMFLIQFDQRLCELGQQSIVTQVNLAGKMPICWSGTQRTRRKQQLKCWKSLDFVGIIFCPLIFSSISFHNIPTRSAFYSQDGSHLKVGPSSLNGAGEGLFTTEVLPANTVCHDGRFWKHKQTIAEIGRISRFDYES